MRRLALAAALAFLPALLVVSCDDSGTVVAVPLPNAPDSFGVERVGQPTKLYQLLGELDLQYHPPQPTPLRTETTVGIVGADLGFSFLHRGRLVFLFGDTIPTPQASPLPVGNGGDASGNSTPCTGLRPRDADSLAFLDDPGSAGGGAPVPLRYPLAPDGFYQPVTLDGVPRCTNEVPQSGFSDGSSMYIFYYLDPLIDHGRAVLAISSDDSPAFHSLVSLPYPMAFVAPRVVQTADVPGLAALWSDPQSVLMWGRWRVHPPILAAAPLGRIGDLSSWRYSVLSSDGTLGWGPDIDSAPEVYTPDATYNCRGPFTVIPVPEMQRWLMIEQCLPPEEGHFPPVYLGQIQVRVATNALGPWSPRIVLYDQDADHGLCHYVHRKCVPAVVDLSDSICTKLEDAGANAESLPCCDDDYTPSTYGFGPCDGTSFPYGAFPMEPLSTWDASSSTLTLYSLLSTFNPYTSVVMKEQLGLEN